MQSDLKRQNEHLKQKIKELQSQIIQQTKSNPIINKHQHSKQIRSKTIQKQCNSFCFGIEYSPLQTCESFNDDQVSFDIKNKSHQYVTEETIQYPLENQQLPAQTNKVQRNQAQLSKVREIKEFSTFIEIKEYLLPLKMQKSQQFGSKQTAVQNMAQNRLNYGSAIRQTNICEQCIKKMQEINQMELLKNKYYKDYIILRTQNQKLRSIQNIDSENTLQRSSNNLVDIYDQLGEERSERSQFSFQNIQNVLLSDRFSLEIQQFLKIINRLLLIDSKQIELSSQDYKLLIQIQKKIEHLKSHLGLNTQPKYLDDLFTQLQKSEQYIKKIHVGYKKIIENIANAHKQKYLKINHDFHQVNKKFIQTLNQLDYQKRQNKKLNFQIQNLKNQSLSCQGSMTDLRLFGQKLLDKEDINQLDITNLAKSQRVITKNQLSVDKYKQKLFNYEKYTKNLQRTIKNMQQQILFTKRKTQNDINQFFTIMISEKDKTNKIKYQQINQKQKQSNKQIIKIQDLSPLVYKIFSFTSCSQQQENIFAPQSKQQLISMLFHIKEFTKSFDIWQKQKQKQMNDFQKNFLVILKFFIQNYKTSEEQLISQIKQLNNMETLVEYIHKYYLKSLDIKEKPFNIQDSPYRKSNTFTFGQKSQTCMDTDF